LKKDHIGQLLPKYFFPPPIKAFTYTTPGTEQNCMLPGLAERDGHDAFAPGTACHQEVKSLKTSLVTRVGVN